jgi:hypothetical protein
MGRFLFDIPEDWDLQDRQARTVHVVGLDGIPWPCKVNRDGQTLIIQRNRDESGHVFVSFPFQRYGDMVVSTGTLPESPQSYCLVTELARGTANRLRNQISLWEEGGLSIRDEVRALTAQAVHHLSVAISSSDKKSKSETARKSLECSMEAIFGLSGDFGRQIVPVRLQQATEARFWTGVCTGRGEQFEASVNCDVADLVQASSDQLQKLSDKPAILGPLLNASPDGMSDRLLALDDFEARKAQVLAGTREAFRDLPASVKLVHAVSGLNGTGHRHLSYPQQLQLTIEVIQAIEDSSADLPVMISFDFPWAERLAWSVGGTHPLQIADSLLRRGVRISMLGLEINLDYWPGGSAIRDPLQWVELIDVWSQLGLPLVVCLRSPSGDATQIGSADSSREVNQPRSVLSDEQRFELLQTVIPMLIARPIVHGVVWQQWRDDDDPRFPLGGLLNADGSEKKSMSFLKQLKAEWLC